jgi:hypothetical protein
VQTDLIEESTDTYFRPPYVGASGWVGVELSKVDDEQLSALIREAFRLRSAKSTASRRSSPLMTNRLGSLAAGRNALRRLRKEDARTEPLVVLLAVAQAFSVSSRRSQESQRQR